MGSSMPEDGGFGGEEAPDSNPFGGDTGGSEKPFDDTPFDAGVEADEESSPEKYIQQLSGKLGQSLRQFTKDSGQPNFDLEKFAINSVLSATNSGEMDQEDQSDIISKVKSSSTDASDSSSDGSEGESSDEDPFGDGTDDGTDDGSNDGTDELSDIEMEEGHNPNFNRKTVFNNATLGVKNGGMEENKYLNLESSNNKRIFVNNNLIRKYLKDMILESPTITPTRTKPDVEPKRITRRNKPWNPVRIEEVPDPAPKALGGNNEIKYLSDDGVDKSNKEITVRFDVGNLRFNEPFKNTNEIIDKPAFGEKAAWNYLFQTDTLSNGKPYSIIVPFNNDIMTGGKFMGFESEVPEIEEAKAKE